jgi:hypothetical protein
LHCWTLCVPAPRADGGRGGDGESGQGGAIVNDGGSLTIKRLDKWMEEVSKDLHDQAIKQASAGV